MVARVEGDALERELLPSAIIHMYHRRIGVVVRTLKPSIEEAIVWCLGLRRRLVYRDTGTALSMAGLVLDFTLTIKAYGSGVEERRESRDR